MQLPFQTKTKQSEVTNAVLSTLAFFSLYDLPITSRRLHELLLGSTASLEEIEKVLEVLFLDNKITRAGNMYSINPWKAADYRDKRVEISKKWSKIDKFYNWLAVLPYVRLVSVINSLAMGTADADSDIDFFIVTEKKRLYFVRSMIIVLFRLLGVYKTRKKIKDKFCFGFFVTNDNLRLENLMLKPIDPYFLFWLASMRPILGGLQYWYLMQENNWLSLHFPNFVAIQRLSSVKKESILIKATKFILEVLLFIPSMMVESILRRIHINHTFKLAENKSISSTTIANARMLKLHAHDVRAEIGRAYERVLAQYINVDNGF